MTQEQMDEIIADVAAADGEIELQTVGSWVVECRPWGPTVSPVIHAIRFETRDPLSELAPRQFRAICEQAARACWELVDVKP